MVTRSTESIERDEYIQVWALTAEHALACFGLTPETHHAIVLLDRPITDDQKRRRRPDARLYGICEGAAPEPLEIGRQRRYWHPQAGDFYVRRLAEPISRYDPDRAPVELPFFCCGRYYATEAEAVVGFYTQAAMPSPPETLGTGADRIDGYDRDDF